ncbi:MAG: amino acid adenylation domain-containing protein, partial [Pseudomonadota bacterium]
MRIHLLMHAEDQAQEGAPGAKPAKTWPLASPQAAIWAEAAAMPERGAALIYNVGDLFWMQGALDAAALRAAIAHVQAAADVFRLRFITQDGEPRQHLAPRAGLDFALVDFCGAQDPEAAARAEALALCQRPFDLARGPLVRHRLLRLAPDRHAWLRLFHHLVIDGWSGRLMADAVAAAYAASVAGQAPPALELGSYLDFVTAEAAYPGSSAHAADVAYWRERLSSRPPLACFAPGPARAPQRLAACLRRALDPEAMAGLRAAAEACGASWPSFLLAAFLVLLGRQAGNAHPACQVALLNRRGRAERATLGPFLSISAQGLDLDLDPDAPFSDLAAAVGRQQRTDFRHARLTPHHQTRAGLDPWQGGGPSGAVFNVLDFVYNLAWPGLAVEYEMVSSGPTPDITLVLMGQQRQQRGGGLDVHWQYNPECHDQAGVERLAERYEALVAAAAAAPDLPLRRLPLMGPQEAATIASWEQGPALPPGCGQTPVAAQVWQRAQATPAAVAVESGDERLTYAELTGLAAALAARLSAAGVGADSPVGLCVGPSPGLAAAFLGIMAAGGAVTPLDPALPPARLRAMAQGVGARWVVAQGRTLARLDPALAAEATVIDLDALEPLAPEAALAFAPAAPAGGQLACIFHTSGSTGRPKPVGVTQDALAMKIETISRFFAVGPGECVCAAAAIAFDPILQQIFIPLTQGGRIWFPGSTLLVDPANFWRECAAREVTHLNLAPTLLENLLEDPPEAALPALRRLVVGGEPMPAGLAPRAAALLGAKAVWNMYGPTEATVDSTGWRVDIHDAPAEVPIGRPLPGYAIRLLDDRLRRVPVGAQGELCIGGMGLARGYLGLEAATREKFIPDPYGPPGARLYLSGDYAAWRADGAIVFRGRRDDQVKVRGQRIELGEVEAALRRQPGVRQVVVCHRPDEHGGRLTAYLVGQAAPAELHRALAAALPRAAVPEAFVRLEELPLLPAGKVDRRALAALEPEASAPAPAPTPAP